MNHYLFVDIPFGEKSIAFCSYLPPKKLIIFVHGFHGSAQETWADLPEMIQTLQQFADADVIFYGYESLRTQANNMSITLFNCIDTAVDVGKMPYPSRSLPKDFQYDSVIIVAHSLGAVVTRLALMYAYDSSSAWVARCRMVLFAPAHFGSRILDNFKECFVGNFQAIKAFSETKYPVLIDLEEGSALLKDLLKRCNELIVAGNGDFLKAAAVVWAETENVVVSKRFLSDKLQKQIPGTTHVSVCKSSIHFTDPVNHLLAVI